MRTNELNRNDEVEDLIPDESYIRNDHNEGIWINSSVRIAKKQLKKKIKKPWIIYLSH